MFSCKDTLKSYSTREKLNNFNNYFIFKILKYFLFKGYIELTLTIGPDGSIFDVEQII